jgi:hypothetical protein
VPTKDGSNADHPLPLFPADEPEQQGIEKAWDRAVVSSRVLKAGILVASAAAIGIAILSVRNPVTLFADVTASLVDKSTRQPDMDQSTPAIQSTADAQAFPSTTKDAPTRDEVAAASESAGQSQTEDSQPPSKTLFRQFQAWAAEQDAQAQVGPVQPDQEAPAQVVQNAPTQVAESALAPNRPMQKHRHVRPVHNARAEIRSVQNSRKKVRREQNARIRVAPAQQDARAQERSVQNAGAPSFCREDLPCPSSDASGLQTFGWRN